MINTAYISKVMGLAQNKKYNPCPMRAYKAASLYDAKGNPTSLLRKVALYLHVDHLRPKQYNL